MNNKEKRLKIAGFKTIFGSMSILLLIFLSSSCGQVPSLNYKSNDIDLEPILSLDISAQAEDNVQNIVNVEELEKLKQVSYLDLAHTKESVYFLYAIQDKPDDKIYFGVTVFLHLNDADAHDSFQRTCEPDSYWPIDYFGEGEVSGNSYVYCVYDLKMDRKGAEGFRMALGIYDSIIYIQKGNLTIRISEHTETLDRTLSNEAIEHIATFFKTVEPVEE